MEVALKTTCLALLVFGFAQSSVLPVEKCTLTDKTCMLAAVQKMVPIFAAGMPDYGVEVLDPMTMFSMEYDLSGLQFSLKDGTLKGLKAVTVDDVNWDIQKKEFSIAFHGDVSVKGHYTAAGRVLILPITGDGQMKLKMKNLNVKLYISYDIKDGYLNPTKYTFDFEVKDNTHFHLDNLFDGNKELSETMLKFLNENWQQITKEFGHPMVDTAAKKLFDNMKSFFGKTPIKDMANI